MSWRCFGPVGSSYTFYTRGVGSTPREITVFFAGMSAVVSLYVLSRSNHAFRKPLHPEITSHRFALWIPSSAPNFKQDEVVNFIKSLGAKDVTVVK